MRIVIDRTSSIPIYRQIYQYLRERIASGALAPTTRLPASRELAATLGVSRLTVTTAYAELQVEGLVTSRTGSGTFVAEPLRPAVGIQGASAGGDWPMWQQELQSHIWLPANRHFDQMLAEVGRSDMISFAEGQGAADMFPMDEIRKVLQQVIRRDGADALGYGERPGYAPLRETIAQILANDGIPAARDHVMITSGSQQALALVARVLLRPGDLVLVESPTYTGAIDLFHSMGVRVLGLAMDEEGMAMERLEDVLHTSRPRMIYTIPNFQNPTGICMSHARRRQLLTLADRYNVPILEDDFVSDLRYDGRAEPALKALDPGGRVIYVSTFSKVLMPGLRLGFLVAEGPVYESLLAYKRVNDLASSSLLQRSVEAYITVGRYQLHLRRACQTYRRRRDAMLEALSRHMPPGTAWRRPQGGLFLWVELPAGITSDSLYPDAAEEGVTFSPGSLFFPAERTQRCMRLNFAAHPEEQIVEGVRRLGHAVARYVSVRGEAAARSPNHRRVTV